MSATSKRNRALLAGEEPVTGKNIYKGEEPMPEYLGVESHMSSVATEAPPDPPEDV